ncbi:MAG TPA: M14 family zinc carboxypeptidase [Mycobacteriales bacterium]|nr:M14 family zinc carboxypeptidase [Mycobacteriales bacterium]
MTDSTGGVSRRGLLKGATAGLGLFALAGPAGAGTLLGTGTASRVAGASDVLSLARVWVTTREEGALLSLFDDTHHVFEDGSYEVLLWPGDLARLQAANLRFEITVADVIARDAAVLRRADQRASFAGSVPGDNGAYRTLDEYNNDMLALVAAHPDDARIISLPHRTREGRSVLGIEIAQDVHAVDGRPVWYMDGLHHAREWPSGENTIMFGFELLENPDDDERIDGLFRETRTILVPVVNPDGFSWTRQTPTTNNYAASLPLIVAGQADYWRKNRQGVVEGAQIPAAQRNPTAIGVDVNRNYSARWGGGGASSSNADQTYRGTGPFSEPEPRNVAELLRERQPIAVNSNHTYTGLVLRPWGYSGGAARYSPDEDLMRDLGRKMCDANGYRNIHSFDLYVTTGTTTDWVYAALGSISYCFEIGLSNFHPDYAGDDGPLHHYRLNREGFILLGETARFQRVSYEGVPQVDKSDPARHRQLGSVHDVEYATHSVIAGRVVDAAGNPVPAQLVAERTTQIPLGAGGGNAPYAERSRAVSATAADGSFAWHLPPSTTPIAKERGDVEAWTFTVTGEGGSSVHEVVVDRGETAQLGDVVLGSS